VLKKKLQMEEFNLFDLEGGPAVGQILSNTVKYRQMTFFGDSFLLRYHTAGANITTNPLM